MGSAPRRGSKGAAATSGPELLHGKPARACTNNRAMLLDRRRSVAHLRPIGVDALRNVAVTVRARRARGITGRRSSAESTSTDFVRATNGCAPICSSTCSKWCMSAGHDAQQGVGLAGDRARVDDLREPARRRPGWPAGDGAVAAVELDVALDRPAQGLRLQPHREPADRTARPQPVHPALDRRRASARPRPPMSAKLRRASSTSSVMIFSSSRVEAHASHLTTGAAGWWNGAMTGSSDVPGGLRGGAACAR